MPEHDPNDSYFYLEIQLVKCMMRSVAFNCHGYGGYTEMNALSLNVCSTIEDGSKRIIVHENLSQSYSANKDESKQSINNETLSQNYSADVDELCSAEEGKS